MAILVYRKIRLNGPLVRPIVAVAES